jgi:hypothetical protein
VPQASLNVSELDAALEGDGGELASQHMHDEVAAPYDLRSLADAVERRLDVDEVPGFPGPGEHECMRTRV